LSVVNDGQPLNQAFRAALGIRFSGGDRRALVRLSGCVELEASRGVTPRLKTPSRLNINLVAHSVAMVQLEHSCRSTLQQQKH